jgi:hypothetical protein
MQEEGRRIDKSSVEPEKKYSRKPMRREDLQRLEQLSKEELIRKYAELKSEYDYKEGQAAYFLSQWEEALRMYYQVKLKYPDIDEAEYSKDWSWVNKIVYVLKKTNRPLLSPEMIELITEHDPALKNSRFRPQTFSANLNKAVKYKRIIAYKLGGTRGYYYVMPEWVEVNGGLKKEYEDKIFFR